MWGGLICAPAKRPVDRAPLRALGTLIGIAVCSSGARAQVQVGPQIRIDVNGGPAEANETSMASSNSTPNEIVGAWNDLRDTTNHVLVRMGVAVSNDGGANWTDFLVRPPPGPFRANVECDPMTAYDDRTGTLWVGAISFIQGANGVFVARKTPGQSAFEVSVMASTTGYADKGWMAAGPSAPSRMIRGVPESCACPSGPIYLVGTRAA